jgi:dTDP-4-amino-4,6-dideoxygalactose transaminase
MDIPFLDLHAINLRHRQAYHDALDAVLDSGRVLLGSQTERFEQAFADACETRYCVAVSSGLEALHLSLRAWDIGPGDEVIVPSHTFIATWLAVTQTGATPVPVEPDPATFNIDASCIEAAITPRTRAVVPVHLYGRPSPMGEIMALARGRGLLVLEDAAQAHGARLRGRACGALGDAGAFSFYPGKNLGALGDAGAVTTDDAALADRLRLLRNYGSRVKYQHLEPGFNARIDELQAAFLHERLRFLSQDNAHRTALAQVYLDALDGVPGLVLPQTDPSCRSSWHLFVIRHSQRDRLAALLAQAGVGTVIHYPVAVHRQPVYAAALGSVHLPLADRLAAEVLSLPIGPTLGVDSVLHVAQAVRNACLQLAGVASVESAAPA